MISRTLSVAALAAAVAFAPSALAVTALAAPPGPKVKICHRTNSTKNPYVSIEVAQDSVDGSGGNDKGKGDHYLNHTGPVWTSDQPNGGDWGDIIPPIQGIHDGLNWTTEGREIYRNGCDPVTTGGEDPSGDPAPDSDPTQDPTPDPGTPEDPTPDPGTPEETPPTPVSPQVGKVTICHRTRSTTNPYVRISVDDDAADGAGGSGDHYGNHTGPVWTKGMRSGSGWGDIIPPVSGVHDGRNWDDAGQAIWLNGCEPTASEDAPPPSSYGTDVDGDNIPDAQDPDDDNDGTPDAQDPDDDNDGTPDAQDPDDDNDGTPDAQDPDSPLTPVKVVESRGKPEADAPTTFRITSRDGTVVKVNVSCQRRGADADRFCRTKVTQNKVVVEPRCSDDLQIVLSVRARLTGHRTRTVTETRKVAQRPFQTCRVQANG